MDGFLTSHRFRWLARLFAIAEFLLWGAFFIEHLAWFTNPEAGAPPVQIWLQQLAHLILLMGYLVMWKWERTGAGLILFGTITFFPFVGGPNAWWFGLMAVTPVIFLFLAWRKEGI